MWSLVCQTISQIFSGVCGHSGYQGIITIVSTRCSGTFVADAFWHVSRLVCKLMQRERMQRWSVDGRSSRSSRNPSWQLWSWHDVSARASAHTVLTVCLSGFRFKKKTHSQLFDTNVCLLVCFIKEKTCSSYANKKILTNTLWVGSHLFSWLNDFNPDCVK